MDNAIWKIDNEIAETNRYLMGQGEEPVPDSRAIEIVKEVGKYAKRRGVPVSDYVYPDYDVNQLTKLLAEGVSEKHLRDFYEKTIKENIDEDVMPKNESEADPYLNSDLEQFFNLPVNGKMPNYLQKAKQFAKKLVPVIAAASIVTMPVAAAVDNVTSTNNTVTKDMYDDTQKWFKQFQGEYRFLWKSEKFNYPESFIEFVDGFKSIDKPLDEPIKTPDDIMKMLEDKKRYDNEFGKYRYGEIEVAPTDLAVWIAAGFEVDAKELSRGIKVDTGVPFGIFQVVEGQSRLLYVDIDNDNKPEVLMPAIDLVPTSPKAPWEKDPPNSMPRLCTPRMEGLHGQHQYCVLDAFTNYSRPGINIRPLEKLLYTNRSWKIIPDDGNYTIGWKEVIGKTPAEIGLDADDRKVFDFTTPKETPGFELATLGAAGLAAYFAAKRKIRK